MSKEAKNIAVVCANGLGDGLMSMVFAENLEKNNFSVTTFSNYLVQLKNWFPNKKLKCLPKVDDIKKTFNDFDLIISTDGASLSKMSHNLGNKYKIYYERDWDRSKTVLKNFLDICSKEFDVYQVVEQNGLTIPFNLQFRKNLNRVIIHPMSTSDKKNWLPEKFFALANRMKKLNFDPVFIVSPAERNFWEIFLQHRFDLPKFDNLDLLASYIYESGYMIGNDSGIGHLAANLGIPTLSLFSRQSVANLWRPNWNLNKVVVPSFQLPGARLRTKYWKQFLTVRKVMKNFLQLIENHNA